MVETGRPTGTRRSSTTRWTDKNKDVDVNVWQFNKGDGSAHGFKKVKCYGQSGLYKHMCLDAVISWWMVYLDDKSMPASDKKE